MVSLYVELMCLHDYYLNQASHCGHTIIKTVDKTVLVLGFFNRPWLNSWLRTTIVPGLRGRKRSWRVEVFFFMPSPLISSLGSQSSKQCIYFSPQDRVAIQCLYLMIPWLSRRRLNLEKGPMTPSSSFILMATLYGGECNMCLWLENSNVGLKKQISEPLDK